MIGEINKQSKEVLEPTVIKKPTAYYGIGAIGGNAAKKKGSDFKLNRGGNLERQNSWDESLIMQFSEKLYNTSISRDGRRSFSVRHLINLEGKFFRDF